MTRKVFCCCYSTGDRIDSSSPFQTDADSAIGMALQVMRGAGDFFGMIDDKGRTLQFMLEEDRQIVMEIPRPSEGGSYSKVVPVGDLEAILLSLREDFSPSNFEGMEFKRW